MKTIHTAPVDGALSCTRVPVRPPDEAWDFRPPGRRLRRGPRRGRRRIRWPSLEAGPADAACLLLHGEPSWSFLYRHMIPVLADAGTPRRRARPGRLRAVRQAAPIERHTYARHVEWVRALVFDHLDLRDVTLVGQDWGGLIGLRLVAEHPDRFARVVAANTGLPTGDFDMPEIWWQFRARRRGAGCSTSGGWSRRAACAGWPTTCGRRTTRRSPTEASKAGPRAMPTLVPTRARRPGDRGEPAAWAALGEWDRRS